MKILIVTFCWPPRNSIGAHRPYSWAKFWAQKGIAVTVLTAKKYAYDEPRDLNLPEINGVNVIEVDYLAAAGSLASLLVKTRLMKTAHWLYKKMRDSGRHIANPRDAWLQSAVKFLPMLAKDHDVVISTYDPKTVHLLGAEIKKINSNLLWIADYRDLWCLNHATRWTKEQREAERMQEISSVGKYADILTTVSDELAQELSQLHKKDVVTINNGFDVSLEPLKERLKIKKTKKSSLSIVYTGKIYPKLRNPLPLLEVIRSMEDEGIIEKGAVQVEIFGGQQDGISDVMKLGEFDHIVRFHGHVSRDIALQAQCTADLLLLLESADPVAAGVLTGKVYEYMVSAVPIISLGSKKHFAIGKILSETKTGVCTEDDPRLIRDVIECALAGADFPWFSPDLNVLSKYSRASQAERLLKLMDDGLARKRN